MSKIFKKKREAKKEDEEVEEMFRKKMEEAAVETPEDKPKAKKSKKFKKINSAHTLVIARKGIHHEYRHFMPEFLRFMPNIQRAPKFTGIDLVQLNPIADQMGCDTVLLLESVNESTSLLWAAVTPEGPTVCFKVETMHKIEDLNLHGICTFRSSPILIFDPEFDKTPQMAICKEILKKALSVPLGTKGMKRVVDTTLSFFILDGRIWFRRYQISYGDPILVFEAGPRFCLYPVVILSGAFSGKKIWKNTEIPSKA